MEESIPMRNDGAFTVSSVSGAETITSPLPDSVDTVSRMAALDWQAIVNDLNESGNALLRKVLTASECETLANLYQSDEPFRSRVVMARQRFGRGEY